MWLPNSQFQVGDEVEPVGLKVTELNGRRGRIAPFGRTETLKEGRVAVLLADSAKAISVQLANLKAAPRTCGYCGKPGAQSKCAGCMLVAYCSKNCQAQHWKKGGHKRECKQLKLTAAPMDQRLLTVQTDTPGSSAPCFICLDGDDDPRPIPLGCGCRGNAGLAHPACVEAAAMADGIVSVRWFQCMTCKHMFTGAMELGLARRQWARVCDEPTTNKMRMTAAGNLAIALAHQGQHAAAAAVHRETHDMQKRMLGPEHSDTLRTALSLANALLAQGQFAKAAVLCRQTLEVQRRVLGPEHPSTLCTANNLGTVLHKQGHSAAAAAMFGEILEVRKRVLGQEHPDTLSTAVNIATELSTQGQPAAAAAMLRETLEVMKRVLGPEHPNTLGPQPRTLHMCRERFAESI